MTYKTLFPITCSIRQRSILSQPATSAGICQRVFSHGLSRWVMPCHFGSFPGLFCVIYFPHGSFPAIYPPLECHFPSLSVISLSFVIHFLVIFAVFRSIPAKKLPRGQELFCKIRTLSYNAHLVRGAPLRPPYSCIGINQPCRLQQKRNRQLTVPLLIVFFLALLTALVPVLFYIHGFRPLSSPLCAF